MKVAVLAAAAIVLSIERISYVWIWRHPEAFRALCAISSVQGGDPVQVLKLMFVGFKIQQGAVFVAWCLAFGQGVLWPPDGSLASLAAGAALIAAGQILNAAVFLRLGMTGVFYGGRFGYATAWCSEFPFSIFEHPQYVGTTLSIWGLFVVMRFPHDDWYVLPLIETAYYAIGARFERAEAPDKRTWSGTRVSD
jgi:methylene-fatty-acyl-phospholipid synthase